MYSIYLQYLSVCQQVSVCLSIFLSLCTCPHSPVDVWLSKLCIPSVNTTTGSGELFSPNWPQHYRKDETCKWSLNIKDGVHVKFFFTSFSLEKKAVCDVSGVHNDDDVSIQGQYWRFFTCTLMSLVLVRWYGFLISTEKLLSFALISMCCHQGFC